VRAVVEVAGIRDILSKCIGTNNKINVVNATIDALRQLEQPAHVAARRGKSTEEIAPPAAAKPARAARAQETP
jgi:small subunit ribosomal protein S5